MAPWVPGVQSSVFICCRRRRCRAQLGNLLTSPSWNQQHLFISSPVHPLSAIHMGSWGQHPHFLWADVLPPLQLMSHSAFLGLRPASEKYLGWRGSWFPGACWQNWPCVKMQMEEAVKKMLIWLLGTLIRVAHKTVIVFSTGVPCVSSAPPESKIWGWRNTSSSFLLVLLFFSSKTLVLDWWKLHKGTAHQRCLRSPCLHLISVEQMSSIRKRSTVCLGPWSLSQSRNKTDSQPYMSLFLATLQSGPCQCFLSRRFFFFSKKDAEKKNRSANVSKFEVRCQLLVSIAKILSLHL